MFHQRSQLSRITEATPGVLCLKDFDVVTVDILFASFPLRKIIFFQSFFPFSGGGLGLGWMGGGREGGSTPK